MSDITVTMPYRNLSEADRLLQLPDKLYRAMWERFEEGHPSLSALDDHPGWKRVWEARMALELPRPPKP